MSWFKLFGARQNTPQPSQTLTIEQQMRSLAAWNYGEIGHVIVQRDFALSHCDTKSDALAAIRDVKMHLKNAARDYVMMMVHGDDLLNTKSSETTYLLKKENPPFPIVLEHVERHGHSLVRHHGKVLRYHQHVWNDAIEKIRARDFRSARRAAPEVSVEAFENEVRAFSFSQVDVKLGEEQDLWLPMSSFYELHGRMHDEAEASILALIGKQCALAS